MAQVLKEDVRENILESAKEEFEEHGFENSSMRRIAGKSKMTVGNLYRYFKSKDELNETIVSPTYAAINSILENLTGGGVKLGGKDIEIDASPEELRQMLSSLSDSLVEIHKKHRIELNILMMGSKLNKELTDWFADLISVLIEKQFPIDKADERVQLISRCYADAIFGGIKTLFRNWKGSEEDLRIMTRIYLNSYLSLLDADIAKLVS